MTNKALKKFYNIVFIIFLKSMECNNNDKSQNVKNYSII
jgi:hypothetical protein